MKNKTEFVVACENGKTTRKGLQVEVVDIAKKQLSMLPRLLIAFILIVATFCLKELTIGDNVVKDNILENKVYASTTETRTEADNILSTVNIQTTYNNMFSTSTGVIISIENEEMLILTARHNCDVGYKTTNLIEFADGSSTYATLKYMSGNNDWAILSIPLENVPLSALSIVKPIVIEAGEIKKGDKVYNIRNHYLDGITIYNGKISNTNMYSTSGNLYNIGFYLETDYVIKVGSSGGGLFNENGRLIGLASQTNTTTKTSLFVPIDDIVTWLNEK